MGPGAVLTKSLHGLQGTSAANRQRRGATMITDQLLPAGSSSGAATASRPAAMAAIAYARRPAGWAHCSRLCTSLSTFTLALLQGMQARCLPVQTPQYYQQNSAAQQYMPGNPQGGEQAWSQPGPPQQAPFQQSAPAYGPGPQGSQADGAWQHAPPQQQGMQGCL